MLGLSVIILFNLTFNVNSNLAESSAKGCLPPPKRMNFRSTPRINCSNETGASTTSTRASGRNQHQPPAAHPIMRPASRKAIKEVNIKGSLICIIHPSTRPPKEQQTHGHIPGAGGPNGYIRYLGTKLSKHGPPGKSRKTSSYLY